MVLNQDHFKFFIEDDVTFDDYIKEMSNDATWGGNLEIYALSMKFSVNFYIYIYNHPMYIVKNFDSPFRNLHLTYHDGSHYNSVRLKDDLVEDLPQYIPLELINCVEQTTNMAALAEMDNQDSDDENEEPQETQKESPEIHEKPTGNPTLETDTNDEILFNGTTIKDSKDKIEKFRKCIITQEGIVLDEVKDFSKCHCEKSNKKYKNCCMNSDLRGEYDKNQNIFYCDLKIFRTKFHYEISDKTEKLSKQTSSDLSSNGVNGVTKQIEKIFI